MATGKQTATTTTGLKQAVAKETKQAETNAQTGNVATVKETAAQPSQDLATGARRGHPAA